jgi:hypothetical protein
MTCRNVQNSLSAHLDGCLSPEERRDVIEHLSGCAECETRFAEFVQVREAVGKLPVIAPPAHLTGMLRVLASQECSRRLVRNHPFRHVAVRFHLWVDNLMRPLALPFAGGLLSAILLFSMLVPNFSFHRVTGNDVPIAGFTDPTVKVLDPFDLPAADDQYVFEVLVDGQGRMIDYSIVGGPSLVKNSELRRQLENKLLFTGFTPATAFGQPTYGRIYISFSRTLVNVKS